MKNTRYILIGMILSLQIVFANMAPAQKIVADRMEDGSGITLRNNTGNTIYVFQNSEDVKNLKDNPRKYSGHEINSDKVPAPIHGSEFLKCTKGNFKYIDIASGGSATIPFNIPNDPSTLFYCYEKIDGKIAKEYSIIINKPTKPPVVEKKENEPEVTPTPSVAEPTTPPPTQPTQPTQPTTTPTTTEPKPPAKPTTPPATQPAQPAQDDVIKKYRDAYQDLYAVTMPVLSKGKMNIEKEDRDQLEEYQKRCRTIKDKVEKIAPANYDRKVEKNQLLSEIKNLAALLSEILSAVDVKKIQSDYDNEVVATQKEILPRLQDKKDELDRAVQQINGKSDLFQWQDKDELLTQIEEMLAQIEQQRQEFDRTHTEFIRLAQLKENETKETLEDLVSEQKEIVVNEYDDMDYWIREYETRVNKIKIPYSKFILFGSVFLLILIALIFYLTARLKKKALRKQAQRTLEHNIQPIEEMEEQEIITSYSFGLTDIKGRDKDDYYPVNMNDIFHDTAIQTVYIKRQCITDVYRFFSEFLKLSDKTNEIGCFIIGQWEYASPQENTYNISLEAIIQPGADVVYGEYDLDFGVEIGVGLESEIFNLRQKTGKEYVHTSWMHSHPGLGLFLSNHDLNVQGQLSYSEHKNRMLAIVIDSNTEDLNMAFFTPKQDGTMNNKEELQKTLSLEDLYQWVKKSYSNVTKAPKTPKTSDTSAASAASDTPATSEKPDVSNYYECASGNPKSKTESVFFSGTAIIEMDQAMMPDVTGLAGYFFGNTSPQHNGKEWTMVENFQPVNTEKTMDGETVGCLLIAPKYSYRDILDKYAPIINRHDFFAVYQPKDDLLKLITKGKDNKFAKSDTKMPTVTFIDMKKWTRRRRK